MGDRFTSPFCTHKLEIERANYFRYKPTLMNVLTSLGWLAFSVFAFYLLWNGNIDTNNNWKIAWSFTVILVFIVVGIYTLSSLLDFVEFDKERKLLKIRKISLFAKRCREYSLEDIYLVQLIKVKTQKLGILYELNLVMKNKQRVSLVAHGRKSIIEEDARVLSRALKLNVCKNYD